MIFGGHDIRITSRFAGDVFFVCVIIKLQALKI